MTGRAGTAKGVAFGLSIRNSWLMLRGVPHAAKDLPGCSTWRTLWSSKKVLLGGPRPSKKVPRGSQRLSNASPRPSKAPLRPSKAPPRLSKAYLSPSKTSSRPSKASPRPSEASPRRFKAPPRLSEAFPDFLLVLSCRLIFLRSTPWLFCSGASFWLLLLAMSFKTKFQNVPDRCFLLVILSGRFIFVQFARRPSSFSYWGGV